MAVLQREFFRTYLSLPRPSRGGVGGGAAIVFGFHPSQYYVVAGTEFGANTGGRADKFARVAVTPALGHVGAFRSKPLTAPIRGLFFLRVSRYDGVR